MSDLNTEGLDWEAIPTHVGLIMDGNGRWAAQRGLERTAGHAAGEAALFDAVDGAIALGVKWLTAYTFSTENWSREEEEVAFLMFFNEDILTRRRNDLNEKNVRMRFAGDMDDPRIPDRNHRHMAQAVELTEGNDGLQLVFAFNYGGRTEIVSAAKALAQKVATGELDPQDVDEAALSGNLYVPEMPDIDLVIRSSGEQRTSNFMLWEAAYAEYIFSDVLWPDFDAQTLVDAIREFQGRSRRFGKA
jgi:undecaprenyl diphosphate synthase